MMTHILMSSFKESTERRKTSFLKELVEKWRPTWNRIKQNNDHTRVVPKIRCCSSFNWTKEHPLKSTGGVNAGVNLKYVK